MIIEYENNGTYIIKIADRIHYYGNGQDINAIGTSAIKFLRYTPYLHEPDKDSEIPEIIKIKIYELMKK